MAIAFSCWLLAFGNETILSLTNCLRFCLNIGNNTEHIRLVLKNMYLCRLILNDSRKYGKIQENIARHPQGNSVFRIRDSIYLAIYQRFR